MAQILSISGVIPTILEISGVTPTILEISGVLTRSTWVHDRFSTTRSAGAVDGTACDGVGERLVVDTGLQIAVSGGNLVVSGGTGTWGQTALVLGI